MNSWHEAGHLRQQSPWKFYNMTEVQNNIYSLSRKAFTSNQPFRLQQEGAYTKAFQYLEQPNKNYDEVSDVLLSLLCFGNQLAYGEDFYPKLHQLYRDMPSSELPQTDENKNNYLSFQHQK